MAKLGIAGPSYTSESILADCNRTVGWYPEFIEDPLGKIRVALYPTPGYSLYGTLPKNPVRGQIFINGAHYAIGGDTVYNVASGGSPTALSATVSNDGLQACIAFSPNQGLIISAGKGYSLVAGVVTELTAATNGFPANPLKCGYVDGYFIVACSDNRYYISTNTNDVTRWSALDSDAIQFSANTLVSMIIDKRETILFGDRVSQAFYNSGRASFPFEAVPSGSMEFGCLASNSPQKAGGSYVWLHGDDRGLGTIVRAQGYQAERISNHAVENAINSYSVKSDAVGWSYSIKGHDFYVLTFLNQNHTWVWDDRTKIFHEWLYWNPTLARYEAHRGINHTVAFGNHIIGDRVNGKLYKLQLGLFTEEGLPARRLRRCPHVYNGPDNITHERLWIGVETGVGLESTSTGTLGNDPQMSMRFSDDGGKTYISEDPKSLGKAGEYSTIVEWRGLGCTNISRVYELSCYEPVPVRLLDAEVDISIMGKGGSSRRA